MMPRTSFILIAALVGFAVGCASSSPPSLDEQMDDLTDSIREVVEESVEDPATRKQADEIVAKIGREFRDYARSMTSTRARLFQLNSNYDTTRDEMRQFLAAYTVERKKADAQLLALRMELKKTVSRVEWDKITRTAAQRDFE